ncbi:hypothetical protein [Methanimicrococcus hongohii]|uniref:hypothetical protein n=1 Tax=Methanimicrococcus hongohii TaxID=3028295 RepID=UPI00292F6534|nr:hypothetical protein [Methanimicrococcus sp. Hf6]
MTEKIIFSREYKYYSKNFARVSLTAASHKISSGRGEGGVCKKILLGFASQNFIWQGAVFVKNRFAIFQASPVSGGSQVSVSAWSQVSVSAWIRVFVSDGRAVFTEKSLRDFSCVACLSACRCRRPRDPHNFSKKTQK